MAHISHSLRATYTVPKPYVWSVLVNVSWEKALWWVMLRPIAIWKGR